jgi:hypothetical protein
MIVLCSQLTASDAILRRTADPRQSFKGDPHPDSLGYADEFWWIEIFARHNYLWLHCIPMALNAMSNKAGGAPAQCGQIIWPDPPPGSTFVLF